MGYKSIIMVFGLCISTLGYGYRRLTYVAPNFCLSQQDTSTLLDDIARDNGNKKIVTYTVHNNAFRHDFVYLSRLDKRRVTKALRGYNSAIVLTRETALTPDLVHAIIAPLWGKCKIIVQHILHDFARQPNATIGYLLHVLDLEELVS
jgi:hypothetical protein